MDLVDGITLAIAAIGAVLGVVNTWNAINQNRPRLAVRLLVNYSTDNVEHIGYSIEVRNLSTFPLTVREVGLSLSPRWKRDIERLLLMPRGDFGNTIPCRIEPREDANFYYMGEFDGRSPKRITAVYAKTACGRCFTARSPIIRDLNSRLFEGGGG